VRLPLPFLLSHTPRANPAAPTGVKKQTSTRKEYVHALNGTLTATERTLCCLLENFQTPEGFNVPKVLQKYIPGQLEFLPFVKEWRPVKDEAKIPERPKEAK
jgi:seryl-tRNA synthetase